LLPCRNERNSTSERACQTLKAHATLFQRKIRAIGTGKRIVFGCIGVWEEAGHWPLLPYPATRQLCSSSRKVSGLTPTAVFESLLYKTALQDCITRLFPAASGPVKVASETVLLVQTCAQVGQNKCLWQGFFSSGHACQITLACNF
jgi:hypothetical protein